MGLKEQTIGLFVFFPVLTTISVGLRLFVRTRLCKGAFGWDDVALLVTYAGLLLWVGFAWASMKYGFGTPDMELLDAAKNDVCYVISGVAKISVALVLYRLDQRLVIRATLILDMVVCAVWTVVVTLILGVGCTQNSPFELGDSVCQATNYAQEASYVIFNVLHVLIPIAIVWGVKISGNLKWAVVSLFAVGLLAAAAAVGKLSVFIKTYHPTPSTDYQALWFQMSMWAVAEHGLSLFAASVLAVRPFFTYMLSRTMSLYGSGTRDKTTGRGTSTHNSKDPSWLEAAESAELGAIGVRNEVDVRSEYGGDENDLQHPEYTVDVYNESTRRLVTVDKEEGLKVKEGSKVEEDSKVTVTPL